jgi:hypothetical protein
MASILEENDSYLPGTIVVAGPQTYLKHMPNEQVMSNCSEITLLCLILIINTLSD